MKQVIMSDLRTRCVVRGERHELLVPGGWKATIPTITPDERSLRAFTIYLEADGLSYKAAQHEARQALQGVFDSGYIRGLRHMLYARAKEYARSHPSLIRSDGTLAGFDPARLQSAYFPFERPGRHGKAFVEDLFREMAEEGRKEQVSSQPEEES